MRELIGGSDAVGVAQFSVAGTGGKELEQ